MEKPAPETRKKASAKAAEAHRWFWDSLDQYLAKKGLKQTRQRHRIIELFLSLDTHVSAEELHEAARQEDLGIGLATIYRTLNLLTEAGLAEQKTFGEGHFVYEVSTPGAHHDHLICLDCGLVIEFENDEIEQLQEKVAAKYGFELRSHRLDLFGHCRRPECAKRSRR